MKFYFLNELTKMMFILCALAFISNYSKGGFIAKKRKEKEVQSIMELEFEKKKNNYLTHHNGGVMIIYYFIILRLYTLEIFVFLNILGN